MSFKKENNHMVDVLFVLTLFFLFALSSLTLVILGANTYRTTVDHMGQNFTDRTNYAYITQKIRQNDNIGLLGELNTYTDVDARNEYIEDTLKSYADSGVIMLGKLGDIDACIIPSDIGGTTYYTYLYLYDSHLYELFTREGLDIGPAGGTPIMELSKFDIIQVNDILYKVVINSSTDKDITIFVSTHSDTTGGKVQ